MYHILLITLITYTDLIIFIIFDEAINAPVCSTMECNDFSATSFLHPKQITTKFCWGIQIKSTIRRNLLQCSSLYLSMLVSRSILCLCFGRSFHFTPIALVRSIQEWRVYSIELLHAYLLSEVMELVSFWTIKRLSIFEYHTLIKQSHYLLSQMYFKYLIYQICMFQSRFWSINPSFFRCHWQA